MKFLFAITFAALMAASAGIVALNRQDSSTVPVLFWVTDSNPARVKQTAAFREWLRAKGYPDFVVKLDTANGELAKQLVQGVSGVAGDILDLRNEMAVQYLAEVGMLENLAPVAAEGGFSPADTYPAVDTVISLRGQQYAFPCNISVALMAVDLDQFRKLGMDGPPQTWNFDEFERIGREYVGKANAEGGERKFFCSDLPLEVVRRTYGLDVFNETLTASIVDDSRNAAALKRIRKWIEVDRLLPSASDMASMAGEAGFGGQYLQLFRKGAFPMVFIGRHAVIQLRQGGALNLDAVQPPYYQFRTTSISARSAGIYKGSKHPKLARYFMEFLASPEYGRLITLDGDALPPRPQDAEDALFQKPAEHSNEWEFHKKFADAALTIASARSTSPFVSPYLVVRLDRDFAEGFRAGLYSAEEAGRRLQKRIDEEIERTLSERPDLRADFQKRREIQLQIDDYKTRNQKIPASWISNPYYLKQYQHLGMLIAD